MGTGLVKKYKEFDIDFVDSIELVDKLIYAIDDIKKLHKKKKISDTSIMALGAEKDGKRIMFLQYYDYAE